MDDPKLKNNRRSNNRGHSQRWHEPNCPCGGRPQAVSPRLAARQANYDANYTSVDGFHRPGSQNRKK